MNVSSSEQRQVRLKQFLKILSEDPSLSHQVEQGKLRSLSELLMVSGYWPCDKPINMSNVVSLSLKKLGLEAGSEELIEYVINGGTVENFIETEKQGPFTPPKCSRIE